MNKTNKRTIMAMKREPDGRVYAYPINSKGKPLGDERVLVGDEEHEIDQQHVLLLFQQWSARYPQ